MRFKKRLSMQRLFRKTPRPLIGIRLGFTDA
jgi:hypothetical protein